MLNIRHITNFPWGRTVVLSILVVSLFMRYPLERTESQLQGQNVESSFSDASVSHATGSFTYCAPQNFAPQARTEAGASFNSYLFEKVLRHSIFRERFLSSNQTHKLSSDLINISVSPGKYFVIALREIII